MTGRMIKYALPLSLLLLPACSQHDDPIAEEPRPMEFDASISGTPQSRAYESDDGITSWNNGDVISVTVEQGGKTSSFTCTLDSDGNVTDYSQQPYWNGTGEAVVTARYSANTVNFADQSSGMPILLRAVATAKYSSPIHLDFTHQFAKVRVKVTGDNASKITSVKVNNYTSYSFTASTGTLSGGTAGYINMRNSGEYFEANVVPVASVPDDFISFGDDFTVTVSGLTALAAGMTYTITIDASSGAGPS